MAALSHRLAAALAARLDKVAPDSFAVRARGETVDVYSGEILLGGSTAATIVEDDDDRTLARKLESAVYSVLDIIQDCISEHLREPWPAYPGRRMANPGTRAEGTRVYAWFGDENAPALTLSPIEVSEIEGT